MWFSNIFLYTRENFELLFNIVFDSECKLVSNENIIIVTALQSKDFQRVLGRIYRQKPIG